MNQWYILENLQIWQNIIHQRETKKSFHCHTGVLITIPTVPAPLALVSRSVGTTKVTIFCRQWSPLCFFHFSFVHETFHTLSSRLPSNVRFFTVHTLLWANRQAPTLHLSLLQSAKCAPSSPSVLYTRSIQHHELPWNLHNASYMLYHVLTSRTWWWSNTDRILDRPRLPPPTFASLALRAWCQQTHRWTGGSRLPACFPVPLFELRNTRAFLDEPLFNFVMRMKKLCAKGCRRPPWPFVGVLIARSWR